jgi:ferric-dicitrate binding protein FerR (iron transport regulator)
MLKEAREVIAATRANPGRDAAMAIYEFIERSLEHDSCFESEVDRQRMERRSFRIKPAPLKRTFNVPALLVLVAVIAGAIFYAIKTPSDPQQPDIFHTEGLAKAYVLADGSQLLLYPHSSMKVWLLSASRRIELLSGGMATKPYDDASWPFQVVAGTTRVVPLGTWFTVLRRPAGNEVVLREGKARVLNGKGDSVDLAPGEFTILNDKDELSHPAPKLTTRPQAPSESRIGTITDIASAFNQQNSTMQIEVGGELGNRYEFTLQLDNPEEWLEQLSKNPFIRVTRKTDLITIVRITIVG